MSVSNFKAQFGGWSADVNATDAQDARAKTIATLGGNNAPEYISEDDSEIAINNCMFNVSAQHLHGNVYSVQIETAE